MSKRKILIVEDDADIRELVRQHIAREQWDALEAADGRAAIQLAKKSDPDLILLDLMIPEIDGKEVCRLLRSEARTRHIPIVILTAKGDEMDRIIGFEIGADDYVAKPFSPRELMLRIRAILKRAKKKAAFPSEIFRSYDLEVNFEKRLARYKGKAVALTKVEFDLLALFLRRAGIVYSRDEIMNQVLGIDATIESRTIDMHISRLRDKLGVFGKFIETVRGVGYRLSDTVKFPQT